MKKIAFILPALFILIGCIDNVCAHPASGIIVDRQGNVYFIYSRKGVVKISAEGKTSIIHEIKDGHWICLDEAGAFSKTQPTFFERITAEGIKPAIIYAGGGSPITMGRDGNFYYCGGMSGDLNPGAKSLIRESPAHELKSVSAGLEDTLNKLDDGITGLAVSPDGSLYLACWNAIIKVDENGKVRVVRQPMIIRDCDEDPADHNEMNRGKPLLRGIAVDPKGIIYAAATSCHCLVKITPEGKLYTVLKSERPWTPTGVALHDGNIYLLEYTNANGPFTEGWLPRVRKVDAKGNISILADFSTK
jgi:hypothetical protein